MIHTIQAIATAPGAVAEGDTSLTVRRAAEPAEAGPDDLAMAMTPKFQADIARGQARAARSSRPRGPGPEGSGGRPQPAGASR